MKTFAERLSYARKLRGHTQESLAVAIGVSRGVTNNLELGRTDTPQKIVINAICNELGIRKEWLLFGTGEIENTVDASASLDELRQLCSNLSEAERWYLIDYIRLMQKHNLMQQEKESTQGALEPRPFDEIVQDAESRKISKPSGYNRNQER